ncbi:hybrid sensor histidine kinase/response regulator [Singulisphaera sp. PoT]|uniref:hybrid sensor histidine kinase/response regulator n=1 Tax=Singulisphaera sp. PoT TaxID=3411797 RepID=UPI003BF4F7B8
MADPEGSESRPVRILAQGRDGPLTCDILVAARIECEVVATVEELCFALEDAQVLVVAEERLELPHAEVLRNGLEGQPAWSDLPIIIVGKPGGKRVRAAELLGNVTVLARPLSIEALVTAVRSGIRARRRQFQVRDLLGERDDADRRKDEFLAMLAHELRNPLAPIRNSVGLMRRLKAGDSGLDEVRDVLDRQVGHMSRLIEDLLDVARITRGRIELRTEPVELVAAARDAARSVVPTMKGRGQSFLADLPDSPLMIRADPTRIEQVVTNLLANASKYTERGGTIRLSVERRPSEAVVRIRDDGVGIDPRILPRIFDLFAQADRTLDRSQGGLGIGLTIVKRLVELHGGTVEALSEGPGTGTEMLIRLPLDEASASFTREASASGGVSTSSSGESSSSASGTPSTAATAGVSPSPDVIEAPDSPPPPPRSLRVLVVEDNRDAADLMAQILRLDGHELHVAYDGKTALADAPDFHPQVVFSDIGLPGLDGYELARRLRREPALGGVMLVAVTGYGSADDVQRAYDAGFDHHLVKPINFEVLTALISQAASHTA